MPLPSSDKKTYNCKLPISGEKAYFKSFTRKDQKEYLIKEANNNNIYENIYNLTKKCYEKNIDDLYACDFDYLFLQLRKVSIDSEIDISFKYGNDNEDKKQIDVTIDIDKDIKIYNKDTPLSKQIQINKMTINLEIPKIIDYIECKDLEDYDEYIIASMLKSVEKDGVMYPDFTRDEAVTFINNEFNNKEYEQLIEYYKLSPSLKFEKEIELPDGKTINLNEYKLIDFFL